MIGKIHEKWQEEENNEYVRLTTDPKLWNLDSPSHAWNSQKYPRGVFSRDFKKRFAKEFRSHYASLPIEELRALFEAKNEALDQILMEWGRHFVDIALSSFLFEGLYTEPAYYPLVKGSSVMRRRLHEQGLQWSFRKFDEEKGQDDAMSANFGWCWSHISRGRELYVQSTSKDPKVEFEDFGIEDPEGSDAFRRLGYVFWDYPRWDGLRQLE